MGPTPKVFSRRASFAPALAFALCLSASAQPTLRQGYPVSTADVFQQNGTSAGARSLAVSPDGRVWIGGGASADWGGGSRQLGYFARIEESEGRIAEPWSIDFGQVNRCFSDGLDFCGAGSSGTAAGLAFEASGRLWAAGFSLDTTGSESLMYAAAADGDGGPSLLYVSTIPSAGRAVAVGGSTAWIAGRAQSRAALWAAGDWGFSRVASDLGRGGAVAVDESGDVWMAGSGAADQLALWRYDPLSGAFSRLDWTNSLGGLGSEGLALAVRGGNVWIAGQTGAAGGVLRAAVWKWDGTSLSLVAVSTGASDAASGIAFDDSGTAWIAGVSGSGYVLWRLAPGGSTLEPRAGQADAAGAAAAVRGPELFVSGGVLPQDAAVWAYSLSEGSLSGTITVPGSFSGGTMFYYLSRDPYFMSNAALTSLPAPASGASFPYALTLTAPATYYVAAIYAASGQLPQDGTGAQNPLNLRLDPFFVPAAGAASGADLDLRLDAFGPNPTFAAPANGSTVAAAGFSARGSITDDTGVGNAGLELTDLMSGATSQPGIRLSGLPGARAWSAEGINLTPGRRYRLALSASDFTGNQSQAQSEFLAASTAAAQGNGRALARAADGSFWVVSSTGSLLLSKYDSAGLLLGSVAVPGAASNQDGDGPKLGFDASGNVWLAAPKTTGALGLWKVSPVGDMLAQGEYAGSGEVIAGGVIPSGGSVWVIGVEQVGQEYRHAVWKFDSSAVLAPGYPLRTARGGGIDGALSAVMDGAGALWSAGVSSNPATGKLDAALWRHAADGSIAQTVYFPDAFASLDGLDVALAPAPNVGVWLAFTKAYPLCGADLTSVLHRVDGFGAFTSTAVWHAAPGTARLRALAADNDGGVWAAGRTGDQTALWLYDSTGTLVSGYPRLAGQAQERALAVDAAGTPWTLSGAAPLPASQGSTAPGAAGAPACSLAGQGRLSGVLTYAAGFSGGETLTVVATTDDFKTELQFFAQASAPAGTQAPFSIDVLAPSTYTVAAFVGADPDAIAASTPIGASAFPAAAVAGQETTGVDFALALDSVPPTSAVTSLSSGATVFSIASVSGTAADATGVERVTVQLEDVTAGLWWEPQLQRWQAQRPAFSDQGNFSLSGPIRARRWTQSLTQGFGGVDQRLATGRRYRVHAAGRDFSKNVQTAEGTADFIWGGPNGQVAPPPPDTVNGFTLGTSSVQFGWSFVQGAEGYAVYGTTGGLLGQTTSTTLIEAGLTPNLGRQACVASVNAFGEGARRCSPDVYTAAAVPPAPFATETTSDTVTLAWADADNPQGTRYQVLLATAPDQSSIVRGLEGLFGNATTTFLSLQPDTTYYAALRAVSGSGFTSELSPFASTRTAKTVPQMPSGVAGFALGVSSIAWTWLPGTGSDFSEVYSTTGALLAATSTPSYAQVGLSTASPNAICVRGVNAAGAGPLNCAPAAETLAAPPGAPELISATSSSLFIGWDRRGNQNATYELSLSTDAFATAISTPLPFASSSGASAFNVEGLEAGATYYLRARARNIDGAITDFSPVGQARTKAAAPGAPENLQALADVPERTIHLTWQASPTGAPSSAFNVWRADPASTSTFNLSAVVSAPSRDDVLFFSGTYYYQVSAVNADGLEGPRTQVAFAGLDLQPPPPVTDLTVAAVHASSGTADLAWSTVADDFSGVSRYLLLESPTQDFVHPASTQTAAALPPGTTQTFTVSVSTQRASYFVIRAEDGAGNVSGYIAPVTVDVIAPQVTFVDVADGAVLSRPHAVQIFAADDLSVERVLFKVDGVLLQDSSSQSFLWDTRLFADGEHVLAIEARDAAGNSGWVSRTVTINYAPPPAPGLSYPTEGFVTKVSTIDVYGYADPYVSVQVQANGLDIATAAVQANGQWSVTPATLTAEGDITLTAIAYESRGFSGPSAPVHGVYAASAPNPPELVSAQALSGGRAKLTWSAPSAGKAPTYYRVYRSTDDALLLDGSPLPILKIADNVRALTYEETPSAEDLYFYAVTSVDGASNESAFSDVVYVNTDRTPPVATIQFSTPQPVGLGTYRPVLALSEPLLRAPIATLTTPAGQLSALPLEAVTPLLWRATVTVTSAFGQGAAVFAFEGTDLAGNVGTAVSSRTLQVDTVGPVGSIALSKTSPVNPGPLTLTLTLDEPAGQTPTLTVTPAGQPALPVTLTQGASPAIWSGVLTVDAQTGDGQARLAFSAQDALGNQGSALVSGATVFMIDTVAPGAPLAPHANSLPQGRIALSWSAAPGERAAYYSITRDGVLLSTHVAPAADFTGSYVDQPSEASHAYTIAAVDLAGNSSAQSAEVSAAADATPPSAPANLTVGLNGFGQVELNWQSGSLDTAHYLLYRATYALTSLQGIQGRTALPPFVDNPSVDGVFHYVVTGLDAVLNESGPSNEVSIAYDRAAPVITVEGVANAGLYNAAVAPAFTVADGNLDASATRARLDGAPFVSGTQVSAEGPHALVVDAADLEGHRSASTTTFTLDFTQPQVSFSVQDGALLQNAAGVSVSITVSDLHPGASTFALYNAVTQTTSTYLSGGAILANGRYTLTATVDDAAGNRAVSSVSFRAEIAPAKPADLSVVIGSTARLTWTKPQPDVVGYRVYRDGQRVSASLHPDTHFDDSGWTPGAHVYEVSAIDELGVEGAKQRASVPAATLGFEARTLTRGFFDALRPTVRNDGGSPISAGPATLTLTDSNGAIVAANAPAVSVSAGATGKLEGVIATPLAVSGAATVKAMVSLPTDAGAAVALQGEFPIAAQDPQHPLLEVFPGTLVPGTLSPVQVRLYNRGSAPMDVVTAEVVNSTWAPVNDVSVILKTADGTVLGSGGIQQVGNGALSAFVGGRQVFFVTVPAGQSMLFDAVRVLVPSTALQTLTVSAAVSTPTYNLPFAGLAGSRSFESSTAQGTISQVPYTATAFADRAYYDQGSSVTITGQALDFSTGAPVPFVRVTAHVVSNGFDRRIDAVTDSSGSYHAAFFPLPNESGTYGLAAAHPNVVSQEVHSTFTIVGFGLQYSNYSGTMAQNSSFAFTIDLQNTGATPLTGLVSSSATLSGSGVALTLDPASLPQTLDAGAKATLRFTVGAAPSSSSSTLSFSVSEAHGFTRSIPVFITVVPAQAIPVVTPQQFSLGMLGGDTRTFTIAVENKGFDTWRGVTVSNPALSWVTLQGNQSLGDIPPGGNVHITLQFAPPLSLSNGTYSPAPLLQLTSLNVPAVPILASVAITSARKGDVMVSIINADKPRAAGGQGVPVENAKAVLTSLDVAGLSFTVNADANGLALFSQIPSGNYAWRAEATGFQTKAGTAVIEPGMTNQIEAILPTAVVSYQWSVTPTTIQDKYNITLNLTFKTDVPAPAIIVDPPLTNLAMVGGQTVFTQLTITNKGIVSAFDYKIRLGADPAMHIELPFDTIPEIKGGQSISVPVKITLDHASCHSGSVGGDYRYQCAAGNQTNASAPSATFTVGDGCGGTGGTGGGGGGGGGFVAATGGSAMAIAVGAPTSAPSCSNAAKPKGPNGGKGTQRQSRPDSRSAGRDVNVKRGNVHVNGTGMCQAARSPELSFYDFYSSLGLNPSDFGFGWGANSDIKIVLNQDGTYTLTDSEGNEFLYVPMGPLNQELNGSGCQFSRPVAQYSVISVSAIEPTSPNPTRITQRDRNGDTTEYQIFGSSYFPVYFVDKNGNYIIHDRDTSGRLLKMSDIHGRYMQFAYDAVGHLETITDQTGRDIHYTYNGAGDRTSYRDVNGDITQYAYNALHQLTQITYPNGGHTYYTYHQDGTVATQSDDDGNNAQSFDYFASSAVITDALGHSRTEEWAEIDGNRKISKIVDAAGGVTRFDFDAQFNVSKITDPLGRETRIQNNINGDPLAVTDAAGNTTQIAYRHIADGGASETLVPNRNATVFLSESVGSGASCQGGGGGTVSSVVQTVPGHKEVTLSSPIDLPSEVTDPKGNRTSFGYDAKGNLVSVQDAQNAANLISYDSQGHVTGSKDALGNTSLFTYDGTGGLASFADPLGRTTNLTRNNLSRVILNVDPTGKQTHFDYDARGNPTEIKDHLNGFTSFGYQPGRSGRLLATLTDAKTQGTTFDYDLVGRPISITNALSQTKTFTYDKKGNLSSFKDAKNQTIGLEYDERDRVVRKTVPEGVVEQEYDDVGNVTRIENYNGSVLQMSYDALNRVTQAVQTLPNGFSATIGYSYDSNGNRTSMTTPWGSFAYTYDSVNRLTRITNPQGRAFTFSYDAAGRRTKLSYPNGIETTYSYDASGQVTQILHRKVSNNTAVAFSNYEYDESGNPVQMTDASGAHTYGYDDLHRLISATHPSQSFLPIKEETFSYDAVGNRRADSTASSFVYNAANRLLENSSYTFSYDANGNRTTKSNRTTNETTSYSYGSDNRLTRIDFADGTHENLAYDARGRIAERSGGSSTSPISTRYVYDGADILAVLDTDNNLKMLLTHGPGLNVPLGFRRGDGSEFYYHSDRLGTGVGLTNGSGVIIERIEFQAYGTPQHVDVREAPVVTTDSVSGALPFYAGQWFDDESGLFNATLRTYDPVMGVFLQEDPLGIRGGTNLYSYAGQQPILNVDPLGLFTAVLGIQGNIYSPVGGGELGLGVYVNPGFGGERFDFGFTTTHGRGAGLSAGLGVNLGYVSGPATNVSGEMESYFAGWGPASFAYSQSAQAYGLAWTPGRSWLPEPLAKVSGAATTTFTHTYSLRDSGWSASWHQHRILSWLFEKQSPSKNSPVCDPGAITW